MTTTHLLTVLEAAEALRLSERKTRELIGSGELPSLKIGSRRMVEPSAIDVYITRQVEAEQDRRSAYRQWGERKLRRIN